jgi:hypothetical protein
MDEVVETRWTVQFWHGNKRLRLHGGMRDSTGALILPPIGALAVVNERMYEVRRHVWDCDNLAVRIDIERATPPPPIVQ